MTFDQLYAQLEAIYTSTGMPSSEAAKNVKQLRSHLSLLEEPLGRKMLVDALRTAAIARSPSADADFSGPAGSIPDPLRVAAWELQSLAVNLVRESDGPVHAETGLAVAAGFAGALFLIQHLEDQLGQLTPGTSIFSDAVGEGGPGMLGFFFDCERQAGLATDFLEEIPEQSQPHLAPQEISIRLMPHAVAACRRHQLTEKEAPIAAVVAVVLLTQQFSGIVDTVFCAETVPMKVMNSDE